jgi:hypothetical protein
MKMMNNFDKKVLIACPSRDAKVSTAFANQLMAAVQQPWCYGVLWVEQESDIVRGRGRIVHEFLQTHADGVLMLDDDMHWNVDGVRRLLEIPGMKHVVGGVYSKRKVEGGLVYLGPQEEEHALVPDAVSVRGVGGGMMLIWREALALAMDQPDVDVICNDKRPWATVFQQVVMGGDYLSEDYAFCERVRRGGGKVWLHRGVRPGHRGEMIFTV